MNNDIFLQLQNLRNNINVNINNNINNINNNNNMNVNNNYSYNKIHTDFIFLNERIKYFLQTKNDKDSIINIYTFFFKYLKKNNLINSTDKKTIIINNELKDLFNLDDSEILTIINLGSYINRLLEKKD
jgi:hypothetical protein